MKYCMGKYRARHTVDPWLRSESWSVVDTNPIAHFDLIFALRSVLQEP